MYKNLYKPLVTLTFFLALIGINNANALDVTVPISVEVISALTATKGDDIHFGKMYASGSITGDHYLVLSQVGGKVTAKTANGGRITVLNDTTVSTGTITLTGQASMIVTIQGISSQEISNGENKATYSLDIGNSKHVANGGEYTLDTNGQATISLGGKIAFSTLPATGTYTANTTFTVSY